ncbi:type I-E CRISPR-associated protein Cas5/CasD [Roseomonas marmotae]|uniref:Type I-E CRISPR-associated protein Cas5/CasD n=1 Tax=Roseomonas marmotae TaxID=2768161 RepID=A0ABS3KIV9_9PROT|nr:type I-E CRISPR-associated protein Cas5/CasD [Roseomonas marmotae]MBO1076952.1 type I-E CRISPR-associated protein Cas5/CasD [Roseomonas marmotae]QTI82060.1 type I-E CRISPR-associated protein Cas5/CasD [Roseomonas marmotae]
MPRYLTFALVAPLASFGSLAVGERREGWDRPARSAVLGLIGACLGLEREDAPAQAALAVDYGLALLCHAPGRLLADFHTAQVPSARRNQRFATRAQELAAPDLNTILSRRDYRSGAWHLAALWACGQPRWSLEAIAEAMRNPVFVPYLGRKSCPLGLPLAPDCVEGTDAPAVLMARQEKGPEARLDEERVRQRRTPLRRYLADQPGPGLVAMDAPPAGLAPGAPGYIAPDDPRRRRVEQRRDQPRNRARWQFDLRQELLLAPQGGQDA